MLTSIRTAVLLRVKGRRVIDKSSPTRQDCQHCITGSACSATKAERILRLKSSSPGLDALYGV